MPLGKFLKSGSLRVRISSILKHKLERLNRTQTSLNSGFFEGNFQRKVGASSREIACKIRWLQAPIENPGLIAVK